MSRRILHVLTPGDHYSPRTGSAIPTVVHGLATATRTAHEDDRFDHVVVLDRSTMHPRYDSAGLLEYVGAPYPSRAARVADALLARVGLPRRAVTAAYRPIADALDQEPAGSIVVAHNAPTLVPLLRTRDVAVALYAHNDLFRTSTAREASRVVDASRALICVSGDLAERMSARLAPSVRDRVHVVENGVDAAQFTPAVRGSGHRLRVMFLGRVVAEKGPDLLLEAARLLGRSDLEVVIVGSYGFDRNAALSPFERTLRRDAESLVAHVSFEPFVERTALPELLRSADVFVAPARWAEPSGLTIGEALATGVPVIASAVGGIPSVVGEAGVLVPPGDPAALADALARLADDPAERRRLAHAGRERAIAHDWHRSWRQLRGVLESL